MAEQRKKAAKIVSSAILGMDFRVVIINGKRYVINPPTIARIAGAAMYLSNIAEAETVQDFLSQQTNIKDAASALSYIICGTDDLREELCQGTLTEITMALSEAYGLLSVQDFMTLSALARNVGKMIANQRQ